MYRPVQTQLIGRKNNDYIYNDYPSGTCLYGSDRSKTNRRKILGKHWGEKRRLRHVMCRSFSSLYEYRNVCSKNLFLVSGNLREPTFHERWALGLRRRNNAKTRSPATYNLIVSTPVDRQSAGGGYVFRLPHRSHCKVPER